MDISTTLSESDGIVEIRRLIKDFLNGKEGSAKVREYISSLAQDDTLIRIYLKGRKYRPKYAWETLKHYAEIRLDKYPELYPNDFYEISCQLQKHRVLSMLKLRDKFVRRIIYLNGEKWDPDEINAELMNTFGVYFLEKGLFDDDVMTNGIIFIQNCSGMGLKHARMYTLHAMMRWLNVAWYTYPIKVEGVYFINVPSYFVYPYKLIKPFFSKKLKERFILSTKDKDFETLHEKLSPDLLPKSLGGTQEDETAFDLEFLQLKK